MVGRWVHWSAGGNGGRPVGMVVACGDDGRPVGMVFDRWGRRSTGWDGVAGGLISHVGQNYYNQIGDLTVEQIATTRSFTKHGLIRVRQDKV